MILTGLIMSSAPSAHAWSSAELDIQDPEICVGSPTPAVFIPIIIGEDGAPSGGGPFEVTLTSQAGCISVFETPGVGSCEEEELFVGGSGTPVYFFPGLNAETVGISAVAVRIDGFTVSASGSIRVLERALDLQLTASEAAVCTPGGGSTEITASVLQQCPLPFDPPVTFLQPSAGVVTPTSPTEALYQPAPNQPPGDVIISAFAEDPVTGAQIPAQTVVTVAGLDVRELDFDGSRYHLVARDLNGSSYAAPQWRESDGRRFPLAYTRGSSLSIVAEFRVQPSVSEGQAAVRGTGTHGVFVEDSASLTGSTLRTAAMVADQPLPSAVSFFDPLEIDWEASFDGGQNWCAAGTTQNRVHVTLNTPQSAVDYETLLEIGSRSAQGLSDPFSVVRAIWGDFTDRHVARKAVDGFDQSDGRQMRYWNPPDPRCQSLQQMLRENDANGSCAAWSQLFHEAIKAQGIAGSRIVAITPNARRNRGASGFLVKNWRFGRHLAAGPNRRCDSGRSGDDRPVALPGFPGPLQPCVAPGRNGMLETDPGGDDQIRNGMLRGQYPYLVHEGLWANAIPYGRPDGDVAEQFGIPGQGNPDPPEFFGNHFIVTYVTPGGAQLWYDPSYGAGPYGSPNAHENASIDGILAVGQLPRRGAVVDIAKPQTPAQELHYN